MTAEERLTQLEHENRKLRLGMLAVLAVVAGLVCIAATQPVAKVVRAQRFEFVDVKGKVRAELKLLANGSPGLWFYDEKGKPRAVLAVLPDGSPNLMFQDEKGKTRAGLYLLADGSPNLGLFDAEEKVIWLAPPRW